MIDSRLYEAFVRIAEAGSISEASRELGVPRPTLSRRLARLEEELGVRLMQRDTRHVTLTRAGHEAFQRLRAVLAELQEAEAMIRQADDTPRGLLRVTVPPGMDRSMARFMGELMVAWPEIELEVIATTRHVDMIGEGFDLALRAGDVRDPSLYARTVATIDQLVVGAPAYLARRGRPAHPRDLADHACLLGFALGVRRVSSWPLTEGGAVDVSGPLASNDLIVLTEAARAGRGLACLPRPFVAADLDAGRLESVLEGQVGTRSQLTLVYPEREYIDPKVRLFIDEFIAFAERERWPTGIEPFAR